MRMIMRHFSREAVTGKSDNLLQRIRYGADGAGGR